MFVLCCTFIVCLCSEAILAIFTPVNHSDLSCFEWALLWWNVSGNNVELQKRMMAVSQQTFLQTKLSPARSLEHRPSPKCWRCRHNKHPTLNYSYNRIHHNTVSRPYPPPPPHTHRRLRKRAQFRFPMRKSGAIASSNCHGTLRMYLRTGLPFCRGLTRMVWAAAADPAGGGAVEACVECGAPASVAVCVGASYTNQPQPDVGVNLMQPRVHKAHTTMLERVSARELVCVGNDQCDSRKSPVVLPTANPLPNSKHLLSSLLQLLQEAWCNSVMFWWRQSLHPTLPSWQWR